MQVSGLSTRLGVDPERLTGCEDLPQHRLHDQVARRCAYLHPHRWTSLGLSLLEAMHLGMPVVVLASTAAIEAVPPGAGVVSAARRPARSPPRLPARPGAGPRHRAAGP